MNCIRHGVRHSLHASLVLALLLPPLTAQESRVRERYTKYEFAIPMRDGVRLFTAVYVPKDATRTYPFLLMRTPYSIAPYGADAYRSSLGPSPAFEDEGFIFVYQDARGRWMSEGEFVQVRPHMPHKRSPHDIDESTDTYDTIEWLLNNVRGHNGRVGMTGISQPGFHVAASLIGHHPALKAASPQAPTADYYLGDDVYHNGAFMLAANYWFYTSFRPRSGPPTPPIGRTWNPPPIQDGYAYFLHLPPLAVVDDSLHGGAARYWQEIVDHTTYDEFWKPRSLWRFMTNISCAVLNVGGWYDAEDPMGPFHIYRAIEKNNPKTVNVLAMGPWDHAGWGSGKGDSLGNLGFGVRTAEVFRQQIEFPFFMKYLKDAKADIAEATVFLTGINEFRRHDVWPPKTVRSLTYYLAGQGRLSTRAPDDNSNARDSYSSDPNRPVPYIERIVAGMTGEWMTEDQRFASRRTDVLAYRSEPLEEDLIVAGPIRVTLHVATTGTDADFVVKLIDEHPSAPMASRPPGGVVMEGYQQLIRGEPFRGKYRNSLEKPEPFTPGEPAMIAFEMPDVYHAFRRGHRVMVHIQSSWFPLVDRNPQQFMEIPKARREDFRVETQSIFRTANRPSSISILVEQK
jgi:hypothetical protein